jgi:hypothetical protein
MGKYFMLLAAWAAGLGLGIELALEVGPEGMVHLDSFTLHMLWPSALVVGVVILVDVVRSRRG